MGFLLALSALTILNLFVSHISNIGKDGPILVGVTLLIYIAYFYILKRIFSVKKISYLLITIAALISIAGFLYGPPKLSNDVYRYMWDGLLMKSDINPYQYVPSEWKLHDLQEANMPLYRKVDWRDKFTPYPPLAQYIFVGAHDAYEKYGVPGGKFIFTIPILLSALFLYFFVDKKLYAAFILSPLLLLEVVGNGHLDGWIVFTMLFALWFYKKERYFISSGFWLAGVMIKVYPIIFVPFLFVDLIRKKKYTLAFLAPVLGAVALYFIYQPFVANDLSAITHYLTLPNEQEYNAGLYRYLYLILGPTDPVAQLLASRIAGIVFALSALGLLIKKYSHELLLLLGILYLFCSTLVFPWYTLFAIPLVLLIISEKKDPKLFFYLTFMQLLVTLIYFEPGKWLQREIMLDVEYGLLLLCILLYTRRLKIQFKLPQLTTQTKLASVKKEA